MRTIEAAHLGGVVEKACLEISTRLAPDVLEALKEALAAEESRSGRSIIEMIIENALEAERLGVPICQDTGVFTVTLTLGRDTEVAGDLTAEAAAGVARATESGPLRPSIVSPPVGERVNTGNNAPPLVEVEPGEDERSFLGVMAKGGGCEMASRLVMLRPGAGTTGVVRAVTAVVAETGARSCPPLVLGVGVGGSFDRAPGLARKALMVDLRKPDPQRGQDELGKGIMESVNSLGIGPGALGGTVTCMAVRVLEAPCHMATLPVAVSVNCHALRRTTIEI